MGLSDLTRSQMRELAKAANTTAGYLAQIRYGNRRPSVDLARDLVLAAAELGIELSISELLRPRPRKPAKNRKH